MSWNWATGSWMSASRMSAKQRRITHLQPQRPSGEKSCLALAITQREEAHDYAAIIGARMAGRLLP